MVKISKVLDSYHVIINVGRVAGVRIKDTVKVIDRIEHIEDIDGNILNIPIIKDELEVVAVYDTYSICAKFEESIGLAATIAKLSTIHSSKRTQVALYSTDILDEQDKYDLLIPDDPSVQNGDLVLINDLDIHDKKISSED